MDRTIFHCDLNSFYASVELLSHPELRDRPVAVCGDPAARHGIVLAKNDPAKTFGVRTAETVWQARRKCPGLVLLPAHHEKYRYYSRLANELYRRWTDLIEPFGIDESWLDVTAAVARQGGDPVALADRLRAEMAAELGLTISVGVSFNKAFAKLGSDYKKPDATTYFSRENYRDLVWPLPVTDLLYVGRASGRLLTSRGILTIGDLAARPRAEVVRLLGKNGGQLHDYATGEDLAPVRPFGQTDAPKSVGCGLTFRRDLRGEEELRLGAQLLAERVAMRLRRHELKAGLVQLAIRDPGFHTIDRRRRTDAPTNTARDLFACAAAILSACWEPSAPVRALTVTALDLVPEEAAGEQLTLFAPEAAERRARQEKLERTMDDLRARYGRDIVSFASGRTGTARDLTGRKEET